MASHDLLPKPLSTMDDLLMEGDSTEIPRKVFVGHNLGYRTFLANMPIHDFFRYSEVANDPEKGGEIAQRRLDPKHAQSLAAYILKGLLASTINSKIAQAKEVPDVFFMLQNLFGKQPYLSLSPLIANIRECDFEGKNIRGVRMVHNEETACFKVFLSEKHVLWIVDGQHRRKGMQYVFDFFDHIKTYRNYAKKFSFLPAGLEYDDSHLIVWEECFKEARQRCQVAVEIHLGLHAEQERQLFHDLNNLGKRVERSLALQFDNSNPVNLFIKEELIGNMGIDVVEKDITDWNSDTGAISRKDLVAVNAILFLNKTNISQANQANVESRKSVAKQFWESVMAIPYFGEAGARSKTIAAQSVAIKALAKLTHSFAFGREKNTDNLNKLLDGITEIDFGHDNIMWRYYELSEEARNTNDIIALAKYLPAVDGSNRDLGAFQGGVMRFGAKHNDIFPLLGDMIRWKLNLPARPHVIKELKGEG